MGIWVFPGVLFYGIVSVFNKLEGDCPCTFHDMAVLRSGYVCHQIHQCCFSGTYGAAQHNSFFQRDPVLCAQFFVQQKVSAELYGYVPVLGT